MATIPLRLSGREPLTSYDYFDLINGTGVQSFYGGLQAAASSAETTLVSGMILLSEPFYSFDITQYLMQTGSFSTWHTVREYNFDLKFNTARIINGDVIVSIPTGMNSGTTGVTTQTRWLVNFYVVSEAGTETFIVSGMTGLFTMYSGAVTADTAYSKIITTAFPISNQTFSPNEKLRMELTQQGFFDSGGGVRYGLGLDPMNRNDPGSGATKIIDDTVDTNLIVKIPFKLEVD